MSKKYQNLLSPIKVGNVVFKNRMLVAPSKPFFIQGPELLNKYVGSSEQNIRDLFTRARSVTPCIILFDEFENLMPLSEINSGAVSNSTLSYLIVYNYHVQGKKYILDSLFTEIFNEVPPSEYDIEIWRRNK